jgi:Pyruvate-formate lyase-activating enzyme
MQAAFYKKENNKVRCLLCPHQCLIREGETGICRVRRNTQGTLMAETYGQLSAIHLDPIEKKPLYHFHPGSYILSIGSVGCNMRCTFCQNYQISQTGLESGDTEYIPKEKLLELAHSYPQNIGIAFTYNEPVTFYEFMFDVAKASKAEGFKNVMVTNGFIELQPLQELIPYIDAYNVDLKSFHDKFYRYLTKSSLEPVKQTLLSIRKAQKHLEITHLIIPGANDSTEEFQQMVNWIHQTLGRETILHLSRYFPRYQMHELATPQAILEDFYNIAKQKLDYVYIGNIESPFAGNQTVCKHCGALLISRKGYNVSILNLSKQGTCAVCGGSNPVIV